jgi:hypothetical protein
MARLIEKNKSRVRDISQSEGLAADANEIGRQRVREERARILSGKNAGSKRIKPGSSLVRHYSTDEATESTAATITSLTVATSTSLESPMHRTKINNVFTEDEFHAGSEDEGRERYSSSEMTRVSHTSILVAEKKANSSPTDTQAAAPQQLSQPPLLRPPSWSDSSRLRTPSLPGAGVDSFG